MELYVLVTVGIAFFCGGIVKGITGMGLPLTSIALMSVVLDLQVAIPLLVIPIIATNILQAFQGEHFKELMRKFWFMLLTAAVGVFAGTYALYRIDSSYLLIALGVIVVLYSINNLGSVRLNCSEKSIPVLSPIVGFLSGLLAGTTGSIGIPVVIYFQALGMTKNLFVQALGIQFLFTGTILTLSLIREGGLAIENTAISAFALLPSVLGMLAGKTLRDKVSEDRFRTWLYVLLLLIGLNLIRKGLF
ncbi:MAG: hypothetical protein CMM52_13160 [Rhodospirillaceae bacterium]|nr:hypothetical protein [Rhodospirillaceae bacterium]